MAVIDAISNADVRRGSADGTSVNRETTVVDGGDYRVALLKSIPQPTATERGRRVSPEDSTISVGDENAKSAVGKPLPSDGRLVLNPPIGALPVKAASDAAVVQPANTDGDSESQPPAGLATALSADQANSRADSEIGRYDGPLKPPRGFFRRSITASAPSGTTDAVEVSGDNPTTTRATDRDVSLVAVNATPAANGLAASPGENSAPNANKPASPTQPNASEVALTAAIPQPTVSANANGPTQTSRGETAGVTISAIAASAAKSATATAEVKSVSEAILPGLKKPDDPKAREPQTTSTSSPVSRADEAHSKAAVVPTPDGPDRTELVQRCADALQHAAQTNRPFRVRLHPPELGALLVEISRDDNVVSARMQVETTSAQQALTEQLSDLRQSLTRHGVTVDRIDVQLVESRMPSESRQETDADHQRESFARNQQERHDDHRDDGRDETPRRKPAGRSQRIARVALSRDEMDIQI